MKYNGFRTLWIAIFLMALTSTLLFAQSDWSLRTNPLGTGDSAMLGKVQFVSATEAWISGSNGTLLHSTDAGLNWTVIIPFPADTVWSFSDPAWGMSWIDATHGWKIDNVGSSLDVSHGVVVYRTTNGGSTWEKITLSSEEGDMGIQIQFVDANTGYVLIFNFASSSATFLKTTNGGTTWNPFSGMGIFYFVDENNGWAYLESGSGTGTTVYTIFRTTNGGSDWTEQFSDSTEGAYNDILFTDLNHGWIVGDNGKVLKTTNGGTSWNFVTNSGINPNERSRNVFFLDENRGWISSKTTAGVPYIQHTTDGGGTWTTQGTPLGDAGNNAIFSIAFVDANNGLLTADWGRICRYTSTLGVSGNMVTPCEFSLLQNYPNPFNPVTTLRYELPYAGRIKLTVYDLSGREVARLVDASMELGRHQVKWDGRNHLGQLVPSGTYIARLSTPEYSKAIKMVLLK